MNGTVKWFDSKKGFGFISNEEGKDIFVHHTGIYGTGFKKLFENDKVTFQVEDTPRGLTAVNVRKEKGTK